MKTPKRTISFLEKKEVEQIIDAIKPEGERGLRNRAIIQTLFTTGLRVAELISLSEIPFVAYEQGTLELSIIGKGQHRRIIYFSPATMKMIKEYLAVRKENDTLLLWNIGVRAVQLMIKKRALVAGFEGIHPHSLRHSFGTYIIAKGENLRMAQELLGHRNISSTQIYTHIKSPELKSAHKRLFK